MNRRTLACFLVGIAIVSGCSSTGVSAESCEDIVDETIALFQRVIDDIDASYADVSVSEVLASDEPLPPIDRFRSDAERIDELAADLGCSEDEIRPAVAARIGELRAESELGRFLIDAFRIGGV